MRTIDTCHISLYHNNKTYYFDARGSGIYTIVDTSLNLKPNDSINIQFMAEGYKISSTTTIPTKPLNFSSSVKSIIMPGFTNGFNRGAFGEMNPIEFSWQNSDNSFYMIAVQPLDTTAELVNPNDTAEDRPVRIFRNEPSISSNYNLEPFQFRYYGYNYIILYHINPEYAALYKFGGNTSLNIKEPTSNLENALGIFTGINSDTILINVIKY
jgi:hypothetical protein